MTSGKIISYKRFTCIMQWSHICSVTQFYWFSLRARHTGYEMTVDKLIGPDVGSKRAMDGVSCSVAPSVPALE